MANIYNEPESTNVKITLKNNVYSYLNTNIGIAKICLITDQKKFGYSDLNGNLKKCLTDASGSSVTPENCVFIADGEGSASHSTTFVYNDNKLGVNIAAPQNKAHFHEPSTGNCLIQITNASRGSSDDNDGMTVGIVGDDNVIRTSYNIPVKIQVEDNTNPGTFVDLATFQNTGWHSNTILDTDLTVSIIPAKTTEAGVFLTHENNTIKTRTAAQVRDDIGAAAISHTQAISTITGLQTALDSKEPAITGTENKVLSIQAGGSGVKTGVLSDDGTNVVVNGVLALRGYTDVAIDSDNRFYRDVYHLNSKTQTTTGTMKITLPKTWSSTMLTIKIVGYNYTSVQGKQGKWECNLGGYNYIGSPAQWVNTSAQIIGNAPFSQVRFAHDGSKCVVLLGNTGTIWNYPQIAITEVYAGYGNQTGWGTGYSISFITSETGITNIVAPTVNSGVSADWNALINKPSTFAPSAHTHIISDVTNLQTALDNKQSTIPYGTTGIEFYAWDKTMKAIDWTYITGKPSTFAPAAHGLVSSTHTVSGLTPGHVLKALSATTYGFAALTPSEIGAPAIGTERSLSVTTAGWVTIATCATGRAYGEFHVYDSSSVRHNFTKIIASTSYGVNNVSVIGGNCFSTRSIAHVRVLYNSSDRIYGGAKLQVYCESPTFTLYVKQFLSQEFTNWKAWNNATPVAEGTPTGWVQDDNTYLQDITNPEFSFIGSTLRGNALSIINNALIGKTTATPGGGYKLEVEGNTLVNGTLKTNSFVGQYESAVKHYHDVLVYNRLEYSISGIMKIVMPKTWSDTMLNLTIKGYNYKGGQGAWECVIGGENNSVTGDWYNCSAEIRGCAPFSQVRLAHDGSRCVIILGETTTVWNYPKIIISDLVVGQENTDGWDTGWSVLITTSESGLTSTVAHPVTSIYGRNATIPNTALIGKTTATGGYKLEVEGNALVNGTLKANGVYLDPSKVKAGTSQAGAGAVAGELWRNTSTGALHLGI